jgi:hypothetical protein
MCWVPLLQSSKAGLLKVFARLAPKVLTADVIFLVALLVDGTPPGHV